MNRYLRALQFETIHRRKWLEEPVRNKRYIRGIIKHQIEERINSRRKNQQTTDPTIRRAVLAKTGGKCYLCLRTYTDNTLKEKLMPHLFFTELEIDHVVPFSRFGPNTLSNYLPVCRRCNRRKSNLSLAEYRAGFTRAGFTGSSVRKHKR